MTENPHKLLSFTDKEIYDVIPEVKEVLLGDRSDNVIFDNTAIITVVNDMNFSINLTEGIKRNLAYYSQLKSFNYDYRFDALIDRLLYKKGICCNFIAYPNSATKHAKLIYMLFRYYLLFLRSFLNYIFFLAKTSFTTIVLYRPSR